MADTITKLQHLEVTCLTYLQFFNTHQVRSALLTAATYLNIPDAEHAITVLLEKHGLNSQPINQPAAVPAPEGTVKKDKGKRSLNPFNVIVMWFSDYAAHYGRHPAVLKVKADHPTSKLGLELTAAFHKTLSSDVQETVKSTLKPFCVEHSRQQQEHGPSSDTVLQAYRKYVEQHPEADIGRLLGLEADPQYKTDPAEMKAQAAEARRQQVHATPSRAPPAAAPTAMDVDTNGQVNGQEKMPPPAASTPMQVPATVNSTEKGTEKRARDEDAEECPKKKKHKSAGAEGEEKETEKKEKKPKEKKTKEETDGGKVKGSAKKEKKEKGEKDDKKKEKEKGEKHHKDKHKDKSEKKKDKRKEDKQELIH